MRHSPKQPPRANRNLKDNQAMLRRSAANSKLF